MPDPNSRTLYAVAPNPEDPEELAAFQKEWEDWNEKGMCLVIVDKEDDGVSVEITPFE